MNHVAGKFLGTCVAVLTAVGASAAVCPEGEGPQAAVESYITAMQESRFRDAYDFVTVNMTDGRERKEWAAIQKLFFEAGGVSIYGMDIRTAQPLDDDPICEKRARVPNILTSRDKFNNQGTTEFELYITVRGEDGWRIDEQETLFDDAAIKEWFPDDEIPEFRDQY